MDKKEKKGGGHCQTLMTDEDNEISDEDYIERLLKRKQRETLKHKQGTIHEEVEEEKDMDELRDSLVSPQQLEEKQVQMIFSSLSVEKEELFDEVKQKKVVGYHKKQGAERTQSDKELIQILKQTIKEAREEVKGEELMPRGELELEHQDTIVRQVSSKSEPKFSRKSTPAMPEDHEFQACLSKAIAYFEAEQLQRVEGSSTKQKALESFQQQILSENEHLRKELNLQMQKNHQQKLKQVEMERMLERMILKNEANCQNYAKEVQELQQQIKLLQLELKKQGQDFSQQLQDKEVALIAYKRQLPKLAKQQVMGDIPASHTSTMPQAAHSSFLSNASMQLNKRTSPLRSSYYSQGAGDDAVLIQHYEDQINQKQQEIEFWKRQNRGMLNQSQGGQQPNFLLGEEEESEWGGGGRQNLKSIEFMPEQLNPFDDMSEFQQQQQQQQQDKRAMRYKQQFQTYHNQPARVPTQNNMQYLATACTTYSNVVQERPRSPYVSNYQQKGSSLADDKANTNAMNSSMHFSHHQLYSQNQKHGYQVTHSSNSSSHNSQNPQARKKAPPQKFVKSRPYSPPPQHLVANTPQAAMQTDRLGQNQPFFDQPSQSKEFSQYAKTKARPAQNMLYFQRRPPEGQYLQTNSSGNSMVMQQYGSPHDSRSEGDFA